MLPAVSIGKRVKVNLMTCVFPKDTRVSFTQNDMEGFSISNLHQYMLQEKNDASDKFIQLQNAQK